jgi:hypothetical protein
MKANVCHITALVIVKDAIQSDLIVKTGITFIYV